MVRLLFVLVTFAVGSIFLTACYYPHIYLLLALTISIGEMTQKELAIPQAALAQ